MIQLNFLQPLCTPDSADTYGQINIKKISFLYLCIGRNGFSLEDNRPYTHAVIRVEIKHNEMRLQSTCSGHKSINTLSHEVHIQSKIHPTARAKYSLGPGTDVPLFCYLYATEESNLSGLTLSTLPCINKSTLHWNINSLCMR